MFVADSIGGSRERNCFLMEKKVHGTAVMTKHCGKYHSAAAPSCVSVMNTMQLHSSSGTLSLFAENKYAQQVCRKVWTGCNSFFFFSVARFNPRTVSPLTTRGRQMAKESSAVGLCRLLRVLPGKNRTKRGMKWNCGHSEAPLSHSGPGGESREFILLLVRQRTAFHNKI